ncbi:MAG TPA: sugar ABC transporter permease [Spirochaetales bacterium]|nr:sugar ABC transporter permease [Spirochaetales bacterium]HRY53353.1 sugar ABC transporter permease [Spirochaetia bacterium]HRZ66239.1 sugar ABC transporter permease [Spirochaetia bacterium]
MRTRGDGPKALLFLAPSLLVFALFVFFPLAFSGMLSLTKWDLLSGERPFAGLGNYARLFSDKVFLKALANTALFSLVVVAAAAAAGLALALALDKPIFGRAAYRAGIFAPYLTSTAAMALVWLWIFDPQYGLINSALSRLGIAGPAWIASIDWALPALMIMTVWRFAGYDMLLFLGGLQGVPRELKEAAYIDGAGKARIFFRITLPLLSPTTLFVVVTTFITMFQNFETVAVMTQGGPVNSTNMLVFYLYQNAFQFYEAGYASAIASVLFAIVVAATALQMWASKRWVHYA